MSDLVEKAKEKAAAAIAKAESEQHVLDILPRGLNGEPRVMLFKGTPHISYKNAPTIGDILAIFDAFDTIPAHDCAGTFRGMYAEPRDTVKGVYACYVKMQAGHNTGSSANFSFFATLSDGQTAQVSVDFDSSSYARKYQGQAWSDAFGYRFTYVKASRGVRAHYYATGGDLTGHCDATCGFSTGTNDGSSVCIYGMFTDRESLANALENVEEESAQ